MLVSNRFVVDIRLLAVLRRDDRVLPVEVIENTRKERKASREIDRDVHQLLDRPVEPVDERHRRGDDTYRKRRVDLLYDEVSAGEVDEQRSQLREHPHHHAEKLPRPLLLEVEIGDLLVDLYEVVVLLLLAGEYLYEHGAADRKRLVYLLIELVALGLALREVLPPGASGRPCRQHQKRYHRDAHQRERSAHAEERHKSRDDSCHIAHDVGERTADHRAHAAYVRVHAGDDVALLFGREERMRHVLQMPVHLVSHVENDALRDPRVDVVLEHTHKLAHCQRGERHKQELYEELHVFADERLIDDAAGDDGRQQSYCRRQQYRDEHEDELQPVRLQIAQYPYQQRLRHLRHILFFFLSEEVHRANAARSRSSHL